MKINVRIDELVLEGFDYHDHRRIADAMEKELSRLMKENVLLPKTLSDGGNKSVFRVVASPFPLPRDKNPRQIGAEVARSVYRSLKA